jgi:hypothetical protein
MVGRRRGEPRYNGLQYTDGAVRIVADGGVLLVDDAVG